VKGGDRLDLRRSVLRSGTRRVGVVTVVLSAGTASAALGLAFRYHLGVAQTLVTVLVGGGVSPAVLYLTWAAYRLSVAQSAAQAGQSRLSQIADDLPLQSARIKSASSRST